MSRFTKRGAVLVVIAVLSAIVASVAVAGAAAVQELQPLDGQPSVERGKMVNETSPYWFVEFPTAPLADGSLAANVARDAAAFRAEASAEGVKYTERMRFQTLWNGMSIKAGADSLAKIQKFASVSAVYPVGLHRVPPTPEVSPDLGTAIAQTGADIAQSSLGLTGQGIKVAVMDTGIDVDHADLGGDGNQAAPHSFPNTRVIKGTDLVGDTYNADPSSAAFQPVPNPDPLPDDCNGHGTHVAGIVGANGGVKGVAPGVRFGAYRVFGCAGSTTDDIMIAAMERALKDDMDILNMSIGDAFNNWPGTPTAAASDRLVRKGMVVVASIGNSQGPPNSLGLYAAGAPGVGADVIGTASFDNTHVALTTFTVTPAGLTIGYANAAAAPLAPTTGSLPLAKTGTPASAADACTATGALPDLTGKAVLIRRGTCGFYEKSRRAQLAGAAAVVLYNNVAGRISPTVAIAAGADGQPVTIPVVAVSDTEGVAINNAIAAGAQTLNWTSATGSFPNPTANLLSSFTSWGVAADLSLKPDLGAPGGLIRSTYPLESGAYATISGTSMASPHVAGGAALLLESWSRHHDDDDDDDDGNRTKLVRDIFQNSADPKNWSGNPGLGFLDGTHRQGAGMVDIDDSILAKTLVTPGKLSLGESQAGAVTKTLRIRNNGSSTVTYALSHVETISSGPSATTLYPFTFGTFLGEDTVTFSKASVTVNRRDSEKVRVTISPDATLPDKSLYGGYIVLVPSDGSPVLRVPYGGFKGDYQSLQVLSTAFGLPLILTSTLGDHPGPWTLTGAAETPNLIYQATHQARRLSVWVVRASDGATLGRATELEYHPRNANQNGVFAIAWDGTYLKGTKGNKVQTAPDGSYRLVLKAEKPLAEKHNPAHIETQTTPVFTIDRP